MATTKSLASNEPYSPTSFIEKQRILARAEYRRVVLALAQDQEPGQVDLAAILFAVGKSFDDMDADIALVRQRYDLFQQRMAAREQAEGVKEMREQLAKVEAEVNELSRQFNEQIEPLLEQQQSLKREAEKREWSSRDVLSRSRRLLEESSDPAIEQQRLNTQERLSAVLDRIYELGRESGTERWSPREEQKLQDFERQCIALGARGRLGQDDADKLHRWKRRRATHQKLPQLHQRAEELQQEINEINSQKLGWDNVALFPVGTDS